MTDVISKGIKISDAEMAALNIRAEVLLLARLSYVLAPLAMHATGVLAVKSEPLRGRYAPLDCSLAGGVWPP